MSTPIIIFDLSKIAPSERLRQLSVFATLFPSYDITLTHESALSNLLRFPGFGRRHSRSECSSRDR